MQHIAVICLWCQSLRRLAQGWFAILAANPGTHTEEHRWDSKTGWGHRKPARRSCFRWNPLNCCLGSRAENPGNRRAIRLLEPLITDPLGVFGKPGMGVLEPVSKGLRGLIENGSFQGI